MRFVTTLKDYIENRKSITVLNRKCTQIKHHQ